MKKPRVNNFYMYCDLDNPKVWNPILRKWCEKEIDTSDIVITMRSHKAISAYNDLCGMGPAILHYGGFPVATMTIRRNIKNSMKQGTILGENIFAQILFSLVAGIRTNRKSK